MSFVDGKPRSATVMALSDVKTLVVEKSDFEMIVDDNPRRILQNYNLRLPKKYEADQYYTDKLAKKATSTIKVTTSGISEPPPKVTVADEVNKAA